MQSPRISNQSYLHHATEIRQEANQHKGEMVLKLAEIINEADKKEDEVGSIFWSKSALPKCVTMSQGRQKACLYIICQ